MSGEIKYDNLMKELQVLEKQVQLYLQKNYQVSEAYRELQKKYKVLEQENVKLKKKLQNENFDNSGEKELKIFDGKSLSDRERDNLKKKINELIEKLDFHLRS